MDYRHRQPEPAIPQRDPRQIIILQRTVLNLYHGLDVEVPPDKLEWITESDVAQSQKVPYTTWARTIRRVVTPPEDVPQSWATRVNPVIKGIIDMPTELQIAIMTTTFFPKLMWSPERMRQSGPGNVGPQAYVRYLWDVLNTYLRAYIRMLYLPPGVPQHAAIIEYITSSEFKDLLYRKWIRTSEENMDGLPTVDADCSPIGFDPSKDEISRQGDGIEIGDPYHDREASIIGPFDGHLADRDVTDTIAFMNRSRPAPAFSWVESLTLPAERRARWYRAFLITIIYNRCVRWSAMAGTRLWRMLFLMKAIYAIESHQTLSSRSPRETRMQTKLPTSYKELAERFPDLSMIYTIHHNQPEIPWALWFFRVLVVRDSMASAIMAMKGRPSPQMEWDLMRSLNVDQRPTFQELRFIIHTIQDVVRSLGMVAPNSLNLAMGVILGGGAGHQHSSPFAAPLRLWSYGDREDMKDFKVGWSYIMAFRVPVIFGVPYASEVQPLVIIRVGSPDPDELWWTGTRVMFPDRAVSVKLDSMMTSSDVSPWGSVHLGSVGSTHLITTYAIRISPGLRWERVLQRYLNGRGSYGGRQNPHGDADLRMELIASFFGEDLLLLPRLLRFALKMGTRINVEQNWDLSLFDNVMENYAARAAAAAATSPSSKQM